VDPQLIRRHLLSDLYKPHTFHEIRELVSPEVAATLDPEKRYGVWWWGRSRVQRRQVSEPNPNGGGRRYRYRYKTAERPQDEWTAVPIPDSGIPREWVDAARERVGKNRRPSSAGRREWGAIGRHPQMRRVRAGYDCSHLPQAFAWPHLLLLPLQRRGLQARSQPCSAIKHHRAERLEERVWQVISGLLKDPERLRVGLDEMIEQERQGQHGDPEAETRLWLDKIAEVNRKRVRYQEMAAEDLIGFEELRTRMAELEEARRTAERELKTLRGRREQIRQLERDKQTLLAGYADRVPDALNGLDAAERRRGLRFAQGRG
jgi:hypothetical protein